MKNPRSLPVLLGLVLLVAVAAWWMFVIRPQRERAVSVTTTTEAAEPAKAEETREGGEAADADAEGEEGEEHAEGEEGQVELDPEHQEQAKLVIQPAQVRPVRDQLRATGTLTADPDLRVDVTSRASGRILRLHAGLGEAVRAGEPLVELDSLEVAEALVAYRDADLRVGLAETNLARRERLARLGDETRRPLEEAQQESAAARAEVEEARAELEAVRARVNRVRELNREGIASNQQREEAEAAFRAATARMRQAEERRRIAAGRLAREQSVASQDLRVSRDTQEAQSELERARVELAHAREILELYGASPGSGATLVLPAPRSGLVVARPVNEGQAVSADTTLVTLQDTSRLLAWIDLPEDALARVREGMGVRIETPALPGRSFSGTVGQIAPELDPRSRMGRARVDIANPTGVLKSQMYVNATISLASGRDAVMVPAAAIQQVEGRDVVYVAEDAGRFERRTVELGLRDGDWQEVREGLKAGEKVVAQGAFMVRAEDQKEQIGGDDDDD